MNRYRKGQLHKKAKGLTAPKPTKRKAHDLAVKLSSGKRTGKAARKEARAAQRAAAAAERAAAEPQPDEVMTDAPKLRKGKPGGKKQQQKAGKTSAAIAEAADTSAAQAAAGAEAMQAD